MNKSGEVYERRALAFLVDFLIAVILALSLNTTFAIFIKQFSFFEFFNVFTVLPFIVYAVINTILTFIFNGKTIAGFIFRLKIIDAKGKKHLSIYQCFMRSSLLAVYTVVIINFFYMIVNKTTRGLFDIVTNTDVISK